MIHLTYKKSCVIRAFRTTWHLHYICFLFFLGFLRRTKNCLLQKKNLSNSRKVNNFFKNKFAVDTFIYIFLSPKNDKRISCLLRCIRIMCTGQKSFCPLRRSSVRCRRPSIPSSSFLSTLARKVSSQKIYNVYIAYQSCDLRHGNKSRAKNLFQTAKIL